MTCDCALPILINYEIIMRDPNHLQPGLKNCLTNSLLKYYDVDTANATVKILMLNMIVLLLNRFNNNKFTYKNIIVNQTNLMYKIGNIAKLEYLSEIQNNFAHYVVAYSIELLRHTNYFYSIIHLENNSLNPDELGDLLTTFQINTDNLNILEDIMKCSINIEFDDNIVNPLYLVKGLTEDDCLPVNCYMFISYSL